MKNKIFVSIFVIILSLVVIQVCFLYKPKTLNQVITQQRDNCKDFDSVTNTLLLNLTGNYKTTVRDIPATEGNNFYWRRKASDPEVSYPILVSRVIHRYGESADKSSQQFENELTFSLESIGLVKNDLNYQTFAPSSFIPNGKGSYGFTKNDDYYLIEIDGSNVHDLELNANGTIKKQTKLPENSSSITVSCGQASLIFDQIYSKIIKKGSYNSKNQLSIISAVDNVVILDIGVVGFGGGYSTYFMVKGNNVELLVKSTQEPPSCDIFESRKVGSGINCIDIKQETERTVTY